MVPQTDPAKWPTVDLEQPRMIFDVKDVKAAVDFYTRLGFEQIVVHVNDGKREFSSADNPSWATLQCGDLRLDLMLIGTDMLSFEVADVAATTAVLEERGLKPAPAGPDDSGIGLTDPDGNVIYITPRHQKLGVGVRDR